MSLATWLAFIIGAGLGAPTRYLVDTAVQARTSGEQPRGTLVVNAAGSLILGIVVGITTDRDLPAAVEVITGTGFCGALTTFSTFALETVRLLEEGAVNDAVKNLALNTVATFALAAIGFTAALNWL